MLMFLQSMVGLLPLVLPPVPAQPLQDATIDAKPLLWAIPSDCLLALSIDDWADLRARRSESAWLQVLSDPRWLEPLKNLLIAVGDESMDADEAISQGLVIAEGLEEIAIWVEGMPDSESMPPRAFFMVRSSATSLDALLSLYGEAFDTTEVDGIVFGTSDYFAFRRQGNLLLLCAAETFDASAHERLAQAIQRLASDVEPDHVFRLPALQSERMNHDFEVIVQLESIMQQALEDAPDEMPAFLVKEVEQLAWIYMGMTFGKGESLDQNISIAFAPNGLIEQVLRLVEPLGPDTLARIPKEASEFSGGELDLRGLMDLILKYASEVNPDANSMWEESVAGLETQMGFHLVEDVIENLSGKLLAFSTELEFMEFGMLGDMIQRNTWIADVSQPKDFQAVLESVFGLVTNQLLGEGSIAESDEAWGHAWRILPDEDLDLLVGVDSRSMVFSSQPAGLDAYHQLAKSENKEHSVLADARLAKVLEALDQKVYSAAHMGQAFRQIVDIFESAQGFGFEDEPAFEQLAMDFVSLISEIGSETFQGWMGTSMEVEKGRLRILSKGR